MNTGSTTDWLLRQMKRHFIVDFNAGFSNPMEECCLILTTFVNINCWFDIWEKLPFRIWIWDNPRWWKVVDPDERNSHVLNLGESALLLDGNTQQHGGCPMVPFYDGLFPVVGLIVLKKSQLVTFITGSTVAGEVYLHTFNSWHWQCWKPMNGSILRQSNSWEMSGEGVNTVKKNFPLHTWIEWKCGDG